MKRSAAAVLGLVAWMVSACGGEFGLGAAKQASVPYEPPSAGAPPDPSEVAAKPCKYGDTSACLERCQSGDMHACNAMGVLFEYGRGAASDGSIASGFYARACDSGYAQACTNLAWLYSLGRGVPHDAQQAMLLFTRAFDASKLACRRGDGHGCLMAGELLLQGMVTPNTQDDGALALFQAACEKGESRGCDYVATLR